MIPLISMWLHEIRLKLRRSDSPCPPNSKSSSSPELGWSCRAERSRPLQTPATILEFLGLSIDLCEWQFSGDRAVLATVFMCSGPLEVGLDNMRIIV